MPLLRIGARIITGRVSPTSFIGPLVSLAGILAVVFLLVTGRIDLSKFDTGTLDSGALDTGALDTGALDASPDSLATKTAANDASDVQSPPVASQVQQVVSRSPDRIRLGSLNWQSVRALTNQPPWLTRLAAMLAELDVIAFQQIEPADYAAFQSLMTQLSQNGGRYGVTASNEIGRGSSRERLVFLWNQDRIMLVPDSAYSIADDADRLAVEPYAASFEVRIGSSYGRGPFRFCLMNVHCRADADLRQTAAEYEVLGGVYQQVRQFEYDRRREEDVLFLGDFVSRDKQLNSLLQDQIGSPIIQAQRTANALRTQQILINPATTREFTGRCGSFRLDQQLGLSGSGADAGSLPVWAELSAEELRPDAL